MTQQLEEKAKQDCGACAIRGLNRTHTCHYFIAGAKWMNEEAVKRAQVVANAMMEDDRPGKCFLTPYGAGCEIAKEIKALVKP